MVMAPVPVILLLFVVPRAVLVILLLSFCQVASVGAVFAFIPVVVVVVMRVLDSYLNARLRYCRGHD
jgi:hypothetical protein